MACTLWPMGARPLYQSTREGRDGVPVGVCRKSKEGKRVLRVDNVGQMLVWGASGRLQEDERGF